MTIESIKDIERRAREEEKQRQKDENDRERGKQHQTRRESSCNHDWIQETWWEYIGGMEAEGANEKELKSETRCRKCGAR